MAMKRFQEPTFSSAAPDEIAEIAADLCEQGYYFVNICATRTEGGNDVLYAFRSPDPEVQGLTGYTVHLPFGVHVPSISEIFPAAFVFENEAHDLFGVDVDGITIDFAGDFYQVSVAYPMNPEAAEAEAAAAVEDEAVEEAEADEAPADEAGEEATDE